MATQAPDTKKAPAKTLSPAQIAAQLTWQLKGDLKNLQIARLRVAAKLARFRDEKMFADLKYADLESYAKDRLQLSRETLYRYLRIYDWVKANHPAWLEPHPKGTIPDLSDIVDLMWIEKELADKRITESRRKELTALQKKAEKGELERGLARSARKRSRKAGKGLSTFLLALRALLRRAAKLTGMPRDVIGHLEAAVDVLENKEAINVAGVEILDEAYRSDRFLEA